MTSGVTCRTNNHSSISMLFMLNREQYISKILSTGRATVRSLRRITSLDTLGDPVSRPGRVKATPYIFQNPISIVVQVNRARAQDGRSTTSLDTL